jgi:hypothetical protein
MNKTRQRFTTFLIVTFTGLMIWGCTSSMFTPTPAAAPANELETPVPGMIINSSNPAGALAQATIAAGQSQLQELSSKATELSLNIAQAANAAAQSTKDFNQRQKMALDNQATIISLNMAQAVATQDFLQQQTNIARDATGAAQSSAATAAQAVYLAMVQQTDQAQSILDGQNLQTEQAAATLAAYPATATYAAQMLLAFQAAQAAQTVASQTAYPLTATPFAATQAALLMQQYGREQQSFVNRVVIPMVPFVAVLLILLFILVIILASRQYLPRLPWPRRLAAARIVVSSNPLVVIAGLMPGANPQPAHPLPHGLTPPNPPRLPSENRLHVEIVSANEPPVAHWVAELEFQLSAEGGLPL